MHYGWGQEEGLMLRNGRSQTIAAFLVAFHHYTGCKLLSLLENRYTCSKPAKELFP